ncbi:MAG: SDR family NAD(P)-dependent oxidoreductase, partial [Ghiorsea sp.]|nr:SDR family NAD(P)-dependent oxidoreductase [Ghiorsea sp.]
DGEELFHWFMQQQGTIQGYTKSLWSGVTTLELAKAVAWAIESETHGLYHITNGQPIDKYSLLLLFKKHTNRAVDIVSVEGRKTDKSFIDTRNERDYVIPSYNRMVADMVKHMKMYPERYARYAL